MDVLSSKYKITLNMLKMMNRNKCTVHIAGVLSVYLRITHCYHCVKVCNKRGVPVIHQRIIRVICNVMMFCCVSEL